MRRRVSQRLDCFVHDRVDNPDAVARIELALEDVRKHVRRYEGLSARSALSEMRLIDKDTIRADPPAFVSSAFAPDELWIKTTSGTTGPPVPIWYSPTFYFDLLLQSVPKILIRYGIPPPDARERPVLCVTLTDNRSCRDWVVADPSERFGLSVQLVVDEERLETFERAARLLDELRPVCLAAKPGIFEVIVEDERRFSPRAGPPELVVSSGAALPESLRSRVEDVFGAPVANAYGMTEFGLIASECDRRLGLHVDHGALAIEVLDAAGSPAPPRTEGELALSSVENTAMPLLRYRTGDLGMLDARPCPCGSREPRLVALSGRTIRCFRFADGRTVAPTHFNDLFSRFPLREFQMTQHGSDRIDVLVEPAPAAADRAELILAVREHVRGRLPPGVAVSVRTTSFDRLAKFERYRTVAAPDGRGV